MTAQPIQDQPLEERLTAIPPARLRPEVRQHLVRVCRAMDRLARLDETSQEAHIDESALRNLLKDGLPPAFVDRYVDLMPTLSGGELRGAVRPAGGQGRPILWQTYVRHTVKDVPPDETFDGLGLTGASTLADLRDAVRRRHPELPESLFEPATGDRLREAIDRLAADAGRATTGRGHEAPAGAAAAPTDLWTSFSQCFGRMFGGNAFLVAWGVFCLTLIVTGFDFVAAVIAAAAGLAIWLVWSLVYCVLSAVFG